MRKDSPKLGLAAICCSMLIVTVMSHSHGAKSEVSRDDDANGLNILFRTYSVNNKTIDIDYLHRFLASIQDKTTEEKSCFNATRLISSLQSKKLTTKIDKDTFVNQICPSVLSALEKSSDCNATEHSHDGHYHEHEETSGIQHSVGSYFERLGHMQKEVWIYSALYVLGISAVGFLLIFLVYKLNEKWHNFMDPFLIALAVGCLCGDSLLHLIPHALIDEHGHSEGSDSHEHSHNADSHADHRSVALKGLSVVVGIFLFFIGEKLMQCKRSLKEKKHLQDEFRKVHKDETKLKEGECSTRLLMDKMTPSDQGHAANENVTKGDEVKLTSAHNHNDDQLHTTVHTRNSNKNSNSHGHSHGAKRKQNAHAHSHSHSHSHTKAHRENQDKNDDIKEIKSNAWMLMMSTSLHNFSDGLAIGAAFAVSLTTGMTTAIAVFCHELPHEIGIFAVLRRDGILLKNALIFNLVSSILCYIGVVLGVMLGRVEFFSSYLLLFIAGTFLYISLVHMMPELSVDDETYFNVLIQSSGILAGISFMLVIALYEDKISNLVN